MSTRNRQVGYKPMPSNTIPLGSGVYRRADAARLLSITPSRLGRWVKGYTYWLKWQPTPRLRTQPPVVTTDLPEVEGSFALSFVELMELRIVKAFVSKGISLQRVRAAARTASKHFQTSHPFASRRVFTDGSGIFAALSDDLDLPDVIELTPVRSLQILSGRLLESYLEEVEFDEGTSLARRWWPLGRDTPIVLDPRICFGAPIIDGTAVRTDTVKSLARRSSTAAAVEAFGLTHHQVEAASRFEDLLAAA